MRAFVGSVGVTLGFGLVFLGGAQLNGLVGLTGRYGALGMWPSLATVIGWGGILVGLLLTQVPLLLSRRAASPMDRSTTWPAPLRRPPHGGLGSALFLVRHTGVAFLVRWAVGGLLFWIALPVLALSHARRVRARGSREHLELVLLYLLFYGYGVGGIWNFVGHLFMADTVAASVGWPAGSPFQRELAFYALGTGTVGLLTPWLRDRFWIAAGLAPSIFVYGAAFTHIRDYLTTGNAAPANWGLGAVGANLLIPTAVLCLLWAYTRAGGFREAPSTWQRRGASASGADSGATTTGPVKVPPT